MDLVQDGNGERGPSQILLAWKKADGVVGDGVVPFRLKHKNGTFELL